MATSDERRRLLAIPCPHCGAKPKEECFTRGGRGGSERLRITTLDGGCHDARWRAALGYEAVVVSAAVPHKETPDPVDDEREPQLVGAGISSSLPERPW